MTQTKQTNIKIGTHVRIVGNTQNAGRVGIVVNTRQRGSWDVEVPSGAFFAELVSEPDARLEPLRHNLVCRATGELLEPGAIREIDGRKVRIYDFQPGRSLASTGRVYVEYLEDGCQREFYPMVVDAEIKVAQ